MKFAILKNGSDEGYKNWIAACNDFSIEFDIIDMTLSTWLSQINSINYDCYLACPPGIETENKIMYDEKIRIVEKQLNKFVYPSYKEIEIHENKKYLSYWLMANKLPHPKTTVFYNKTEALNFIKNCELPIVGKINIGASGKGVTIFRDKKLADNYIESAFAGGIKQNWGPNLKMGGITPRIIKMLKNPSLIKKRLDKYKTVYHQVQKDYVIFQEYTPHNYEWRIVKIGDSFFGHQKVKQGDKASGTKGIDYVLPPTKLLDFVKNVCEKYKFNSMAVDCFEDGKGGYLINEMQCIFGHVQDYICEKDNKPGRMKFINNEWVFEEGLFNANLSYNLRIENILTILKKQN